MRIDPTGTTRIRATCTQPGCPFKTVGCKTNELAISLVQFLAGESRKNIFPGTEPIVARFQCIDCAWRVIQGNKPFHTEEEWDHLDELGRWHHRRQRRADKWRYQLQ